MAHHGSKAGSVCKNGRVPSHEDIYSPPSNYSTYSGEVKYIFDPDCQGEEDYSQIATIRRRLSSWQQAASSGTRSVDYPNSKQNINNSNASSRQSQHRPTTANYCNTQDVGTPPSSGPRRRTWSPPPFGSKMGIGGSIQTMRSYHSNDHLDLESHHAHIYEDLENGPPRIAPISGMLSKAPGKGIVRPIAFKPVIPSRYMSTPNTHQERREKITAASSHTIDDGYGSQDYHGLNPSNLSHSSIHIDSDRSFSFSSDGNGNSSKQADRPESFVSLSNLSRLSASHSHMEGYVQTPSPSDSGVGELEAILRERDAEINALRNVMDKNERAIFQVYEEKKLAWQMELHELKEECDRHLKIQQRRAFKAEQLLMLQIYKLQQDKKSLNDDSDKIKVEKNVAEERCLQIEIELGQLKSQMEETKWQTHQKSGEIVHVKQQLKDTKDDLNQKSSEVLRLKSQLRECEIELEQAQTGLLTKDRAISGKDEELRRLRGEYNGLLQDTHRERRDSKLSEMCSIKERTPEKLCVMATCTSPPVAPRKTDKSPSPSAMDTSSTGSNTEIVLHELDKAKVEFETYKSEYEKEREQWLEEKNKVIRYQKQLQLNYVQMFRKNRMLEAEVEQLSLELENRDMKLLAMNGEESVC